MTDEIEDEFPDPAVRNPPRKIFLVVGNIEEDCSFSELGEVSWAEEQIFDADIEYAPQREVDGLMAKVCDLEEKLARLDDLRRWRPMSEHPVDDRLVLLQCNKYSGVEPTRFRKTEDAPEGKWSYEPIYMAYRYSWTYIPGQEPKEEV